MEDVTVIVTEGLQEAEDLYKSMLLTSSPSARFPNKGKSLLHAGSHYHSQLAELEADLDTDSARDARWRRKATKRRRLEEAALSFKGVHTSMSMSPTAFRV